MKTKSKQQNTKSKNGEKQKKEPCVFNCDYCPDDKFFTCTQIGRK